MIRCGWFMVADLWCWVSISVCTVFKPSKKAPLHVPVRITALMNDTFNEPLMKHANVPKSPILTIHKKQKLNFEIEDNKLKRLRSLSDSSQRERWEPLIWIEAERWKEIEQVKCQKVKRRCRTVCKILENTTCQYDAIERERLDIADRSWGLRIEKLLIFNSSSSNALCCLGCLQDDVQDDILNYCLLLNNILT